MFYESVGFTVIILITLVLFKNKPKTPPSYAAKLISENG